MSMAMSKYQTLPYGELRMYQNFMLLSELGVLGRIKRYSKIIHLNPDPNIGRSSNKPDAVGLELERPVTTFSEAYALVTDGAGDVIIVDNSSYYDGSTYTSPYLTETDVAVAKADLTIVGMGDPMTEGGFKADSASAGDGAMLILSAVAKNVMFKNLRFNTLTGLQGAIKTAANADFLKIDGCVFLVAGASGPKGYGLNMAGAALSPVITNNRLILGTLVATGMTIAAGATGGICANNHISTTLVANGTTPVVAGLHFTAGNGITIKSNYISGGETAVGSDNIATGILIDDVVINSILSGPNYIGNCDAGVTNTTDTTNSNSGLTAGEGWIDITHA